MLLFFVLLKAIHQCYCNHFMPLQWKQALRKSSKMHLMRVLIWCAEQQLLLAVDVVCIQVGGMWVKQYSISWTCFIAKQWNFNKGQLEVSCKPTYRMRRLWNKGAILVLAWNYLIVCVFYYLSTYASPKELQKFQKIKVVWGITLPFAGWLADVYLGWYKVIHWNIWIMWVASMLATASSVVTQLVNVTKNIALVLHIIMAIGFGGYQANVIQFGTDQLHDASTDEITSFIIWYVWTYFSSGIVLDFAYKCTSKEYHILGQLLVSISLIIYCHNFIHFVWQ